MQDSLGPQGGAPPSTSALSDNSSVTIARMGKSEATPLHLYHVIHVPASTSLWVICPRTIFYGAWHIDSYDWTFRNRSVQIQAPHDCPIYVFPDVPLGRAFMEGWQKLPVELKIMILEHNLVFPYPIRKYQCDAFGALLAHMRSTPEIAELARNIFYTKNTFKLHFIMALSFAAPSYGNYTTPRLSYPNPTAYDLIRTIDISTALSSQVWMSLRKMAQGMLRLNYVKLELGWFNQFDSTIIHSRAVVLASETGTDVASAYERAVFDLMGECLGGGIHFACSGELVIKFQPGMTCQAASEFLEGKVSFEKAGLLV